MCSAMLFWVLAAALVVAVIAALLFAMTPKPEASGAADYDVAFYRSRQKEIERLVAAGLMSPEDGSNAQAEAGRRLIAVRRGERAEGGDSVPRRRLAQVLTVLAVPALAVSLYLVQGRPDLPGMPYATRTDLNRTNEDLARLIARLDAHLAETPDDARGWELAFPVYMRLERFDDAAEAAQRLIQLKGDTPERQATLAEALIFKARGIVGEAARVALDKALAANPGISRARFYKGLAVEQSGDTEGARAIWQALLDELPEGNEKAAVRATLERLGPSGAAADSIRALPEAEQRDAIRGMVEALAARLKQDGGSAAEWQRLLRALAVLGEKDRLAQALGDARINLKGREGAASIEVLAGELGLAGDSKP